MILSYTCFQHLVGNIKENDMKHLRAYAARVEELSISIPETPTASNSVYFRLGELRDGNEPLFPSLTRLSITVSDQHDLSHLTLFLSPSLKSLSIVNISTKARASLQLFLTMLNPNLLESIQLTSLELNPSLTSAILRSRNLRCIEFNALRGSLNISDLESVLLLPTLKHYTVDANSISERMLTTPPFPSYPSLSLEELHITGPPQFLLDLLNSIGDAAILSKIYCKISSRVRPLDPFLEIVAVHHSQSLRQLILSCPDRWNTDTVVYLPKSPYDALKGLPLLENLEILGIPFEDVNDALCSLTPNWPHMKRLHLSLMADGRGTGRLVSLPTLRVVAQSCPLLTDLQCPLEMKSPGGPFSSYLLSHGLERLSPMGKNVRYDSQKEEIFPVARYLYALFPRLEAITGHGSTILNIQWKEVHDLMKMCQALNKSAREIDASRASIDGASLSNATRS